MEYQRRLFFDLVRILGKCPDPYGAAHELLKVVLMDVEALRVELGEFVDALVLLGRVHKVQLPAPVIHEIRLDLARMSQEPRKFGVLFYKETRERCGRAAVPLLASAIFFANNWVEFASDWLESMDGLRVRADEVLR